MDIKTAWQATPGPIVMKDYLVLFFKGICMGIADIIPGVSGGTIAFITGIYPNLLAAVSSFNIHFIKYIWGFQFSKALAEIHLRFLLPLFLGIILAMVSVARVVHWLLSFYPVYVWSLFFGLIGASIFVVLRKVEQWSFFSIIAFFLGTALAWFVTGLVPAATPEDLWFIFLCGAIAICAMILPGLSGAFLLLILGKYAYLTAALRNPFSFEHMVIIGVFAAGCACGLMLFSRGLKWFLTTFPSAGIALLAGIMCGAMRKVWPWRETLDSVVIRGKVYILAEKNILPVDLDGPVFGAFVFMACGALCVLLLDFIQRGKASRI